MAGMSQPKEKDPSTPSQKALAPAWALRQAAQVQAEKPLGCLFPEREPFETVTMKAARTR